MVALVRTLSLSGCFVKTDKPLPMGGKFALTITDSESHFSAIGRVASQANDGVGIEFTGISPIDQARLEDCLAELAGTERRTPGVLVVDDHSVTRSTIRSVLTRHSFPVCGEAENGKQAVEKVKELRPEVVLLDIEMPVMNGIQAAREIRRISPSTKILFFTIHKDEAMSGIRLRGAEWRERKYVFAFMPTRQGMRPRRPLRARRRAAGVRPVRPARVGVRYDPGG